MINILSITDAIVLPTGFGKVHRELFDRLRRLQTPEGKQALRLAHLSGNWMGTSRFPGIFMYCGTNFCQNEFPAVAMDFMKDADPKQFILWTLMDPPQTSWLAYPEESPYSNPVLAQHVNQLRSGFKWVMHFPIDGEGLDGGLPYWVAKQVEGADFPVAMSEWAQRMLQKAVKKDVRFISHAVDTNIFKPGKKSDARTIGEQNFIQSMAVHLIVQEYQTTKDQKEAAANVSKIITMKKIQFHDKFVVTCVMANRARKYWHYVLDAFAELSEKLNGRAVLVGVCGDAEGRQEGALPLADMVRWHGLRLAGVDPDPQVWLIEGVGDSEVTLATLYRMADVSLLISGGEGFGLPQLESHACGVPCVVGDYSASSELMVNKREGIAPQNYWWEGGNRVKRPIYNPSDIASRLKWIHDNPSWAEEAGLAGVEQASKRTWDVILPQWLALFDEAWKSFGQDTIDLGSERKETAPAVAV